MRIGVAILTMGTRPAELAALLESVAGQETPASRVVVVGNGSPLPPLPGTNRSWCCGIRGRRRPGTRSSTAWSPATVSGLPSAPSLHPSCPVYLGVWTVLTLVRARSAAAGLRAWFGGFAEGVRTPCPPRRAMRWSTVWHMTRLGRPPVI